MSDHRRKEIRRQLPEEELDKQLAEADNEEIVRRLSFIKNLYRGETIKEAANRVGRSEATGDRWADDWNEGGVEALAPSFGGGRPPKLDEEEQAELLELLREDQPWKSQEIQQLLNEELDVECHPGYLGKFLRQLGLSYAKPRPKRPTRPENPEEVLEERVDDALDEPDVDELHNKRDGDEEDGWDVDDDVCTDGGTVIGFLMRHSPIRTTIRDGSGTWMIHTSNGRWSRPTSQRLGSTRSTVRVWCGGL